MKKKTTTTKKKQEEKEELHYTLSPKFIALLEFIREVKPNLTRKVAIALTMDIWNRMKEDPDFDSLFIHLNKEEGK